MTENKSGELSPELKMIADNLKVLEGKADLSASAYIVSERKVQKKSNRCLIVSLSLAFILAVFSIVFSIIFGSTSIIGLVIGIILAFLSLIVSVFSLSDRIFGWNKSMLAYRHGYNMLKGYQRESYAFRKNHLPHMSHEQALIEAKVFEMRYASLVASLEPNDLTDMEFLLCKQAHKKKIRVSQLLDKNPCIDVVKAYNCKDEFEVINDE